MYGKADAGVYGPKTDIHKTLGNYPSVYQAVIHAIEACALELQKRITKGRNIHLAALSLGRYNFSPTTVNK